MPAADYALMMLIKPPPLDDARLPPCHVDAADAACAARAAAARCCRVAVCYVDVLIPPARCLAALYDAAARC